MRLLATNYSNMILEVNIVCLASPIIILRDIRLQKHLCAIINDAFLVFLNEFI